MGIVYRYHDTKQTAAECIIQRPAAIVLPVYHAAEYPQNASFDFKVSSKHFKADINGASTFRQKRHRTPEKCHRMQNRAICAVSIRSNMQNTAGNSRSRYRRIRSTNAATVGRSAGPDRQQIQRYQIDRRRHDYGRRYRAIYPGTIPPQRSRRRINPNKPQRRPTHRPRPESTAGADRRSPTAPAGFSAPGIG